MAGQTDRRSAERRQSERRSGVGLDFHGLPGAGAEILGYAIEARDGYLGRAADFCVEEESSVVTGLLATTRRLLFITGRVFVPLSAIDRIDQRARKIYVRPSRDELKRGSRKASR
jgi:hypothetical protein